MNHGHFRCPTGSLSRLKGYAIRETIETLQDSKEYCFMSALHEPLTRWEFFPSESPTQKPDGHFSEARALM